MHWIRERTIEHDFKDGTRVYRQKIYMKLRNDGAAFYQTINTGSPLDEIHYEKNKFEEFLKADSKYKDWNVAEFDSDVDARLKSYENAIELN